MIPHADSIAIGVVVATHPEGQSIDVVIIEDGSRISNVQVMVPSGSSNTGAVDLPVIGAPQGDAQWDLTQPVERYVRAVLAFYRGVPICIGFLLPQITQLTFQRQNFKVERHASDVYSTINSAGDMETYHPSGTYFRIGASPVHEDLTAQDFDQQWAIKNNTGAAVHAHLVVANAGSVVATVDIDPAGNVTVTNNGNLTTTTTGNAMVNVSGTTTINSTGNVSITSQGNATVTANGGVTISSAGAVAITGAPVSLN
jgi:hypothetical protein